LVRGAKVPIVLTSRADDERARLFSMRGRCVPAQQARSKAAE
jgi:hypothetical protein